MLENPYCSASSLRPPARIFMSTLEDCLDLKVIIPKEGGAYPILAQGEGTQLLCGVVAGHKRSISSEALPNSLYLDCGPRQHPGKEASGCHSPTQSSDRPYPACDTCGNMATYVWTITRLPIQIARSLDIRKGERVGIAFTISTKMGHPMHLHGHDFQVVEIDGEKYPGLCAIRFSFHHIRK